MSLTNFIRNTTKSQYFRRLVVRAIEDAIVLFLIFLAVWAVCAFASAVLGSMGVL